MSRVDVALAHVDGCNRRDGVLTLRELREKREMTLRQVEAETGFNRGTLSEIENGKRVPSPLHMLALSDLYGVLPGEWQLILEYRIPESAVAADIAPPKEAA